MEFLATIKLALQSFVAIREDVQEAIKWFKSNQAKVWERQNEAAFDVFYKKGIITKEEKDESLRGINQSVHDL